MVTAPVVHQSDISGTSSNKNAETKEHAEDKDGSSASKGSRWKPTMTFSLSIGTSGDSAIVNLSEQRDAADFRSKGNTKVITNPRGGSYSGSSSTGPRAPMSQSHSTEWRGDSATRKGGIGGSSGNEKRTASMDPIQQQQKSNARSTANAKASADLHSVAKGLTEAEMQAALRRQKEVLSAYEANLRKATEMMTKEGIAADFGDDDDDFLEGDDKEEDERMAKLVQATFGAYNKLSANGGELSVERTLEKIRESLHSTCLICFANIGRIEPQWQCEKEGEGCFRTFHLTCIQKWARTECRPTSATGPIPWPCPNCRKPYEPKETPLEYLCYCKKVANPEDDLWMAPHSCGQACGRSLLGCDHSCTLLCHPGPCPPCPQTLMWDCYCGQDQQTRRCSNRGWSCGEICDAMLPCRQHTCPLPCHAGPCPPCPRESLQKCRCGREKQMRLCAEADFQCSRVCGRSLSCGFHSCEKVCHKGACGSCPHAGPRICPCGKKTYNLPCTQKVPSCGDTCNKPLSCGLHACPERCHEGDCPPCRITVTKKCRCGERSKLVQCCQDYICDRKCKQVRNCGKHECRRKCCPGNCPPCQEVCNEKLGCKNHRCEANCHAGRCLPCPITVESCYCFATKITVPCGAERKVPPPRCRRKCCIPPTCHHPSREAHRCHFEPCPPCQQECSKPYADCDHKCLLPCHDPIPAPPVLSKKQKRQRDYRPPNPPPLKIDDVACPPCPAIVKRSCKGEHQEREVVCSSEREFSCGGPCDNVLACGNHRCSLSCHYIAIRRSRIYDKKRSDLVVGVPEEANPSLSINSKNPVLLAIIKKGEDTCKPCTRPCAKKREPFCKHPCPRLCHPGLCDPCEVEVRRKCFCGIKTIYVKCYETHDVQRLNSQRCCGNMCRKIMPYCTHPCAAVCHDGECPEARTCKKRVKVKCSCGRLSEERVCEDVQKEQFKRGLIPTTSSGVSTSSGGTTTSIEKLGPKLFALLECDKECERLKAERQAAEEIKKAELRKRKEQEDAVEEEKRKKAREREQRHARTSRKWKGERSDDKGSMVAWFFLVLAMVAVLCLVVLYFLLS